MILTASKLITCRTNASPLDKGAVVITRGMIQAIGSLSHIKKRFPRQKIYCLQNAVIMPGLINTHTHLELPPLLDRIRARTFSEWVLNLISAKKLLNRRDYASAAAGNISIILRTGTTTVGEICTHGVSSALLKKRGLRAVVFYEKIDMGQGPKMLLSPERNTALIMNGLSPHTPYTVSEAVLNEINMLSNKDNLPLAMHVAESKDELRLLQRKRSGLEKLYQFAHWDLQAAPLGPSSFAYLDRIGFLSPRLLAIHAVQITDQDVKLIRRTGVSVAHCPRSNRETNVGRMPLGKLLNAGIPVGLGTDSLASSPTLNMWDEMRYAYRIHRRDGITPQEIINLATIGGAVALRMGAVTGSLEPGKKADIIAVPLPALNTGDLFADVLRETNFCVLNMVNGKMLNITEQLERRSS
jgi:cytosine/adenosine deaminase-related metal-dependent hydrolase